MRASDVNAGEKVTIDLAPAPELDAALELWNIAADSLGQAAAANPAQRQAPAPRLRCSG
jgi:hypothetical protein